MHNLTIKSTLASLLYILSSAAWAGPGSGSLVYGSVATIPTLSGTMLILLSLLLTTIGYRILRQKGNNASSMMVVSLIAIGALVSGLGGVKLVNEAYATIGSVSLNQPGGGSVEICVNCGENAYRNDTEVVLKIKSITKPDGCDWEPVLPPGCTVGLLLNVGEDCHLDCNNF